MTAELYSQTKITRGSLEREAFVQFIQRCEILVCFMKGQVKRVGVLYSVVLSIVIGSAILTLRANGIK
jgi:hypothetical protein